LLFLDNLRSQLVDFLECPVGKQMRTPTIRAVVDSPGLLLRSLQRCLTARAGIADAITATAKCWSLHHKLVDEPKKQSGNVPRTVWREPYLILLKQPIPFPESPQFASGDRSPDGPLP